MPLLGYSKIFVPSPLILCIPLPLCTGPLTCNMKTNRPQCNSFLSPFSLTFTIYGLPQPCAPPPFLYGLLTPLSPKILYQHGSGAVQSHGLFLSLCQSGNLPPFPSLLFHPSFSLPPFPLTLSVPPISHCLPLPLCFGLPSLPYIVATYQCGKANGRDGRRGREEEGVTPRVICLFRFWCL